MSVSISRLGVDRWSASAHDAAGYEHRVLAGPGPLDAAICLAERIVDSIPNEDESPDDGVWISQKDGEHRAHRSKAAAEADQPDADRIRFYRWGECI